MELVLVFVILLAVVAVVGAPLRRGAAQMNTPAASLGPSLEAAREAKYAELRDAELDHRTGKLSDEDHAALELTLRQEALSILNALEPPEPPASAPPAGRGEGAGSSAPAAR